MNIQSTDSLHSQQRGPDQSQTSLARQSGEKKPIEPKKPEYLKPVVQDKVEDRLNPEKGVAAQAEEIRKVFKTDTILRTKGYVDLVAKSGNQILNAGITNSVNLGEDTGTKDISEGSELVSNNNILETWKRGGTKEKRQIVQDF